MGLSYAAIANKEQAIRSHTGLSKAEFLALAQAFGKEWEHYIRYYTWRQRAGAAEQRAQKQRPS